MKKLTGLIILVFIFSCAGAQEIEWQKTIGGSNADALISIKQTYDGGYILGGHSASNISGDKTENGCGNWDYWMVKINATGSINWQNTIGGNQDDDLTSIQQTIDGGYILGGYSLSAISCDKTENGMGGSTWDYWIVKTDSMGNIQWQNTIGGSNVDRLFSTQQTTDGGYILGGHSASNASGDKTENNLGGGDYWILKTDSIGNIQWQNTIGGNANDWLISLQQTADGGFILGGHSPSGISGDKTESSKGGYDYWMIKTDSTGNILWQNTIGGSSNELFNSIQQTFDGGYILGGYSSSGISGDKTESSMGNYDYWIVKTDSIGNIEWQNTIGGNNDDDLYSIHQTTDGGYILGGYSMSNISGDKREDCLGDWDYWVVKTDSLGDIQWQNTIGGNSWDQLFSVVQSADGRYLLGGTSSSNISGDKTENCHGTWDYWVTKLTDRYNSITGKCFFDFNSNNVQDSGEVYLTNKKIIETNTGRLAFSNQDGSYSVAVIELGSYTVAADSINYFSAIPTSHNINFTGINQTDSSNNFAFQPTSIFNDLRITITPLTLFRSGFNASYTMHFENVGTTLLNASVILYLNDSNYNYVTSSVTPTTVTSDSVMWINIQLAPYQSGDITVTIYVKPGLPIGTQLNAFCVINPTTGDATVGDNYGSWKVFTVGAVDPNDILVDEDTLTTLQLVAQPYLEYIIRFQNTGNDTCFSAKILNPIDTTKLELSTIEFVASSHPVNLKWIPWERNIEFTFDNILLPDSNVNEFLSHGYVRYRIKPKAYLSAGKIINNSAAIYFDYNNPVLTNTATTLIVLPPTTYASILASVCSSYLSPSGNYTWTTTGSYTDTLVNVYGGDSIITINLTINNTAASINIAYCDSSSYVSPSSNYTWTTSGLYHDTIPNAAGCDSLITVNLSLNNSTSSIINANSCDNYISPSGNYTWTTSGTYNDTIPNAVGCDSVITVNLAINNSSSSSINVISCDNYISPSGNYTWTTSGTYNDTIPNAVGCDSIITIQLAINSVYNTNLNTSICQGDSILLAGTWQTLSGNYTDILFSVYGCDSVIQTALNIDPVYSTSDTVNLLQGDSIFLAGAWQTLAGVYIDNFQTQSGCDSVVTSVVNIITSVEQLSSSSLIVIKPNPSSGMVTIALNIAKAVNANLSIQDMTGRIIFNGFIKSNEKKMLDVSSYKNGVYIVKIIYETRVYYCKMVKE